MGVQLGRLLGTRTPCVEVTVLALMLTLESKVVRVRVRVRAYKLLAWTRPQATWLAHAYDKPIGLSPQSHLRGDPIATSNMTSQGRAAKGSARAMRCSARVMWCQA